MMTMGTKATAKLRSQTRPDGSILIWQDGALPPYPRCMTERFLHWAAEVPDRLWMAERGPDGGPKRERRRGLGHRRERLGRNLGGIRVLLKGRRFVHRA
jgi:feruloyl-CoA synthase